MSHFFCEVINQKGMHARAAAKIVNLVEQFNCDVTFTLDDRSAPANSLIKLLTLNAPQGSRIKVEVSGREKAEVSQALQALFGEGFGE